MQARRQRNRFDEAIGHLMESIRQGADSNSQSLQANGLLQSHQEYNTTQKKFGKIIEIMAHGGHPIDALRLHHFQVLLVGAVPVFDGVKGPRLTTAQPTRAECTITMVNRSPSYGRNC